MRFRTPGPIAAGLLAWLALEIAAFAFVVSKLGLGGALVIGLLTLAAGFATLRRVGSGALAGLQAQMTGREMGERAVLEGTLAALGGVLLILPGFVSDAIGLALAAPSIRGALARRFGKAAFASSRVQDGVIDLDPAEWRPSPNPQDERTPPSRRLT